jgi:poly-D-alanine transfer protein DltD
MFEMAKDMSKNDKDIVFVLNPQAFIDAGVDPAKVEGWIFAKIKVEDAKGKMVEVDKLLKPFNLQ